MKKTLILILMFYSFLQTYSQDYKLEPINHSNKWYNGYEWSIDSKNEIEIRVLHNDFKSNKLIFTVVAENNSDQDFNIDPDSIYCLTTKFNKERILKTKPTGSTGQRKTVISDDSYLKSVIQKCDTIYIENADKLVKNLKGLVGLGFLFDSDNVAINRGYAKMDYYKENLLLKHTIEPKMTLSKILIVDGFDYIEEMELVIIINNHY